MGKTFSNGGFVIVMLVFRGGKRREGKSDSSPTFHLREMWLCCKKFGPNNINQITDNVLICFNGKLFEGIGNLVQEGFPNHISWRIVSSQANLAEDFAFVTCFPHSPKNSTILMSEPHLPHLVELLGGFLH